MSVDKKRETTFDVTAERLFAAVSRYVEQHASYYTKTAEDVARMELRTDLHPGFFAYNGEVHFVVAPEGAGSRLAVEVRSGPLFVVDWLSFWERYLVHVTVGIRALL